MRQDITNVRKSPEDGLQESEGENMDKSKEIIIQKDHIIVMGQALYPPFLIDEVKSVLGEGRLVPPSSKYENSQYVWDELGIQGWMNEEGSQITFFQIIIAPYERNLPEHIYDGRILIGKKDYRECKWKMDLYFSQVIRQGCFELATLLPEVLPTVEEEFQKAAACMASLIEVSYLPPKRKKPQKYKLKKQEEPVLVFSHLNFKLAVIQELMYKKELLKPRFNIYEFVEEYTKREIDIEEEGYDPIQEALNWFEALPIPLKLAEEITELQMDGGNEIYHQIIPFWDGEDGFFDVNELEEAEVRQFPNLQHVTLLPGELEQAMQTLKNCGVSVDVL